MAHKITYHRLFTRDVVEAADWYDERSPGRGKLFADAVDDCAGKIANDPHRFGRLPMGLRYARVLKYPYVILFEFENDVIFMWGVLHTARSMEKWFRDRSANGNGVH